MLIMKFDDIVKAVGGKVIKKGNNFEYKYIDTDTRKIHRGSIYIAIKGNNFNGNDFVSEASSKGAVICIADEINFNMEDIKEYTSVILVHDTRKALLDLAAYYRSLLNIKIIGITGSTGKTSTKDLTCAALSGRYRVYKTSGNFNNEIGMPLTLLNLGDEYDIAVIEMGMSNFGEIHNMAKAARPDMAIITNIGISHIENLKSRENILKAKLEITDFFTKENILIVNGDNDLLSKVKSDKFKVIKAGMCENCDLKGTLKNIGENYTDFSVQENGSEELYHIDLPGVHNVSNSLLAIECAKNFNMAPCEIRNGFKNLQTASMRLDIIKGKKFTVVNDCYNASPDSVKAAIDVLCNIKCNRKIAVLGTMMELGDESYEAHKNAGKYAKEKGINILVTSGKFSDAIREGYEEGNKEGIFQYFDNYDSLTEYLLSILNQGDAVLIKASRAMKFETISDSLLVH